jgi:pimeloyl-ACP methyl ester carboxylesterase
MDKNLLSVAPYGRHNIEIFCVWNARQAKQSSTGKVIGVGHSFGGSLHYIAAVRRPELYERLVLLDSPMFGVATRGVLYAAHWLDKTHVFIPHVC